MKHLCRAFLFLLCLALAAEADGQGIIKHNPTINRNARTGKTEAARSKTKPATARNKQTSAKPTFASEWKSLYYSFVYVRGGTFQMGATPQMKNPDPDEFPVHTVTVDGFFISKYEVTQALWEAVMGSNPSKVKGPNLPVTNVSWTDCQTFLSRLTALAQAKSGYSGISFCLPTEAQWEFAARGGNVSKGYQYSGSNSLEDVAWYGGNSSNMTHVVGTKRANELGLYDMSGNVWEWCQDWNSAYSSSPKTNPIGALKGRSHMSRGGSWYDEMMECRSSNRISYDPDYRYYCLGLRLTLSEDNVMEMDLEEARKRLRAIEKAANEGIKDSAPTFVLN